MTKEFINKEEEDDFNKIKIMPNDFPFTEEDLKEIYSQDEIR